MAPVRSSHRRWRRALKQAAPLGRSGWAIYVVRKNDRFDYGVFRTDSFFLERTPIIAILPKGAATESVFFDAIVLAKPIRVPELVTSYRSNPCEASRESIQGAGRLVEGMLGVDGITVFSSDGNVVAYNAFLHFSAVRASDGSDPIVALGGARRRTFDALSAMVGHSLVAAFVRSQDGFTQCEVAPPNSPVWTSCERDV